MHLSKVLIHAALFGAIIVSSASAANIITFANNANSCGGAVICSTNGTAGYLNNGTGQAFDLSTFNSWFQIDTDAINLLGSTQTQAEPDGGAGAFLVVNDTGLTVTSYSIVLSDTFTSSTASVAYCSGNSGAICDNFQAGKGSQSGTSESLSGANYYSCTNGTQSGQTCSSTSGQAAANFTPGTVTYTWSGLNITAGQKFDLSFASWQSGNNATPFVSTPEPSAAGLMAGGLFLMIGSMIARKRVRTSQRS